MNPRSMGEVAFPDKYRAEVERDESGEWIGNVPSLRGVHTHARTLAKLRGYLQDAIALWLEAERIEAGEPHASVERASIEVNLDVRLPSRAKRAAVNALRSRDRARTAEVGAAEATLAAVRELSAAGLTLRDSAEVLGLSHQRVDQLLRSDRT